MRSPVLVAVGPRIRQSRPLADWFRSPEWGAKAQQDFESRLGRARASSRPQYVRIKAVSLEDAGRTEGSIALLRRIVQDYPDAWPEVAFAHERLGDLYLTTDPSGAVAEYRLALATSPSLSGTTGEVHLKLGEVLLETGSGTIGEIEALLAAARSHVTFNSTAFRFNVLAARVAAATGDDDQRRQYAAAALELIDATPQFSRHPTVGLVRASPSLLAELQAMACA